MFNFGKKKQKTIESVSNSFDSIIDGLTLKVAGAFDIGTTTVAITSSTISGDEDASIIGGPGSCLVVGSPGPTGATSVDVHHIDVDTLIVHEQLFVGSVRCNHLYVGFGDGTSTALLEASGTILYNTISCGSLGRINGRLQHTSTIEGEGALE